MSTLFTIGHSTHPIEDFIILLKKHGVTAVADVRSQPYSAYSPQYSQDTLKSSLQQKGLAYVFLGLELGAKSGNPACYRNGKVQYELLAQEPLFAQGLERLRRGMEGYSVALMCAEKDPLDCHRAVLVSRKMYESGTIVEHIHTDGLLESQEEMESRMFKLRKIPDKNLIDNKETLLAMAYKAQSERIAYTDRAMLHGESNED